MPAFTRYIGIHYSGAETPDAPLPNLRVYLGEGEWKPLEVAPVPAHKYWTRKAIAAWLVERLGEGTPTLVGIDHAFSFPLAYFDAHGLAHDWPAFLDDFQRHWPTDEDNTYVDFCREGVEGYGNAAARMGNTRWRRLTEIRAGRKKSVFDLGFSGSVAKATHAGLPWLRFIREQVGERVHFWPFDGWELPRGRSVVVEVDPALWSRRYPFEDRDRHQQYAFAISVWLSMADRRGTLALPINPALTPAEREVASIEGWILGPRFNPFDGSTEGERVPGIRISFPVAGRGRARGRGPV